MFRIAIGIAAISLALAFNGSRANAQEQPTTSPSTQPLSRVDTSAPLSGGERWVKQNGRWRLQRINYRYMDHTDYAARPAPPPTRDDFAEPARASSSGFALRSRWFGGGWNNGWGYGGWGPGWGAGWGNSWGIGRGWGGGWNNGFGWNNGWGGGWGVGPRWGIGMGRGFGFGGRRRGSRFGFRFGGGFGGW